METDQPAHASLLVDQGATTIWECWDSYIGNRNQSDFSPNLQFELQTPILSQFKITTMNSFSHAPLGAVGEWLYRVVLGLEPSETGSGFSNFTINPKSGQGVSFAKGEVQTARGKVAVNLKIEDRVFYLGLVIPPNTTAIVVLPAASIESITECGMPFSREMGVTILDAGRLKVVSGIFRKINLDFRVSDNHSSKTIIKMVLHLQKSIALIAMGAGIASCGHFTDKGTAPNVLFHHDRLTHGETALRDPH